MVTAGIIRAVNYLVQLIVVRQLHCTSGLQRWPSLLIDL